MRIGPNPPKTGEQSILLMQGEQFVLRDLVRAAMIKSANDSCVAIAEAVAGDVPTFVKMMNEKAKELGAKNTHFCNPHGLHDANHYTTAYDLALIAQAAMQHPEFNEMTRTQQAAYSRQLENRAVAPAGQSQSLAVSLGAMRRRENRLHATSRTLPDCLGHAN